jgi:hypothetical protein
MKKKIINIVRYSSNWKSFIFHLSLWSNFDNKLTFNRKTVYKIDIIFEIQIDQKIVKMAKLNSF